MPNLRRELSSDELALATRAYREGQSLRTIGSRIGAHKKIVRRELVAAGVRIRAPHYGHGRGRGRPARLTLDQLRAAARLYHRTGQTFAELASHYGLTGSGLAQAFRRHGIPRKKRGWRGGSGPNRADLKTLQEQADREARRETLMMIARMDARRRLRLAEDPFPFNQ